MKKQTAVTFFTVTLLFLVGSSSAMSAGNHAMDHGTVHNMDKGASQGESKQASMDIQAEGKLNSVNLAKRKINVSHTPIAVLGWPAMRMDFTVQPGVDLQSLKPNQKINFSLQKSGEYDYVVTDISLVH